MSAIAQLGAALAAPDADADALLRDFVARNRFPLLDGSTATISATSLQSTATGGSWAEPIATAARIALVVWVAISGSFILWVIMARRRRARRRSTTAGDPRVR